MTLLVGGVQADDTPHLVDRAARVSPQYELLSDTTTTQNAGPGYGLAADYEFFVRPKFRLGILMAYRWFPGGVTLGQLGYGLLLRHYVGASDPYERSGWHPYTAYGLLFQISTLGGRTGTASSYDAALLLGSDFFINTQRAFIEGGFHISHASFFEQPILVLCRWELSAGLMWEW